MKGPAYLVMACTGQPQSSLPVGPSRAGLEPRMTMSEENLSQPSSSARCKLLSSFAKLHFIAFLQAEHLISKREYQAAADKYVRLPSLPATKL